MLSIKNKSPKRNLCKFDSGELAEALRKNRFRLPSEYFIERENSIGPLATNYFVWKPIVLISTDKTKRKVVWGKTVRRIEDFTWFPDGTITDDSVYLVDGDTYVIDLYNDLGVLVDCLFGVAIATAVGMFMCFLMR